MSVIDIKFNADDSRAARLSNLTPREFSYEKLKCGSIEGFLQGLKEKDLEKQKQIFLLAGTAAWKAGQSVVRQGSSTLFFQGRPLSRNGDAYTYILMTAYDAVYDQDPTFQLDLLATGEEELRHSIGGSDQSKTILTEMEFLYLIYRVRSRAHRDATTTHTTKRPYLAHD